MSDKPKLWNGPSPVGEGAARGNEISGAPYQTHIAPGVISRKMGVFSEVVKDEPLPPESAPDQLFITGSDGEGGKETRATPLPEMYFHATRFFDPGTRISRKWLFDSYGYFTGVKYRANYFNQYGGAAHLDVWVGSVPSILLATNKFGKDDYYGSGWPFDNVFAYNANSAYQFLVYSVARIGIHRREDGEEFGAVCSSHSVIDGTDEFGVPVTVPAIVVLENNGGTYFGPVKLPLEEVEGVHNYTVFGVESLRTDRLVMWGARYFTPGLHPPAPQGELFLYISTNRGRSFIRTKPFGDILADMPDPPTASTTNPDSEFTPYHYLCDFNLSAAMFAANSRAIVLTEDLAVLVCPYYNKNDDLLWVQLNIGISSMSISGAIPISFDSAQERFLQSYVTIGDGTAVLKLMVGRSGVNNDVEFYQFTAAGASRIFPTGLPATATKNQHFGTPTAIKRYRSEQQQGVVVMPVWDEEGYALYISKDRCRTWKRKRYIKRAETLERMDEPAMVSEIGGNFGLPRFMGTPEKPAPMDVAVPSRYGETT